MTSRSSKSSEATEEELALAMVKQRLGADTLKHLMQKRPTHSGQFGWLCVVSHVSHVPFEGM